MEKTIEHTRARRAAGERALRFFGEAGFARVEPALLQPTGPFLDVTGEDLRGRLFLTSGADGEEFCLRPDYTIPVCLDHLKREPGRGESRYAYLGPVFRAGADPERMQTGLESFGRSDIEAADAEILGLALEGAEAAGARALAVKIGDARLFDSVVTALGVPEYWRRRLRSGVARGRPLTEILKPRSGGPAAKSGVLAALEQADHAGARALVEDLLEIAGITTVGGRTVAEIADRFLEQASGANGDLPSAQAETLAAYLDIEGHPDAAAQRLRALASSAGLNIKAALASFEERVGFLAARGLDIDRMTFRASFVRELDYYTGFVFEAAGKGGRPAVVGGRYDGLARKLGAREPTPAIGAAIWLDQLGVEARHD